MGNQFPPFQTTDGEVDVPKLVDLYKYYEGVGIQARAQMMTAVNWLLTFAIGLLVYSVRETLELRTVWVVCTKSSEQGIVVAVVGVALSILSYATINHFEAHVYRNWLRATRCKYLVPDLFLLVAEAGTRVPNWKMEKDWPAARPDHPSLRKYKDFERGSVKGDRRAARVFTVYRVLIWALAIAFVVVGLLALALPACSPAIQAAG